LTARSLPNAAPPTTPVARSARFPRDVGWQALLVAGFVVGVALRAWQLDIQILIDDEWHAVHKLLRSSAVDIATHLGYADYSIPLTLYYQWLYRTIGLSEWGMHAPSLVAGVALLLVGPRLLAPTFAVPTRAIWTALVAVSPLLVYHSKIARPYALTSVLTFVAIVVFRQWWLGRRRRDALLYLIATALAGWLHPTTLAFTLLPFAYYGVRSLLPFDRGQIVALARLGTAVAFAAAAVLAPPLIADWTEFSNKAGRDSVTLDSLYRTALMLAGSGQGVAAVALWAAAAWGLRQLVRRDAYAASYVTTIIVVGIAAVAASRAEWISHPLVLARYALPALPFILLLAAEGLASVAGRLRGALSGPAAAAVATAVLLASGPIVGEWHYPNQFWGHLRYQFDYDARHNPYTVDTTGQPISAFYVELGTRPPGTVTLIETPWRLESHFNALSKYQDVHHQLIRIGLVTPLCGTYDFGEYADDRAGMRMRWLVHLSRVLRGEGGADYLVVHRRPGPVAADPGAAWPDMTPCMPAIEAALGPPMYGDEALVVFALPRVSPLGNNRRTVQQ
jgi:hypothetical protein